MLRSKEENVAEAAPKSKAGLADLAHSSWEATSLSSASTVLPQRMAPLPTVPLGSQDTPPPPIAELKQHLGDGTKGSLCFCCQPEGSHDPFGPRCRSPPLDFWNVRAHSVLSFSPAFLLPLLTSHTVPAHIYLALLTLLHKSFLQVKSLKTFPLNSLQTVSKRLTFR